MIPGIVFLYVLLTMPEGTHNALKFFAKLKKENPGVFVTRTLNEFLNQDEIMEAYKHFVIKDITKRRS